MVIINSLDAPKYCGTHAMPVQPYKIRDKVFVLRLFKHGEGESAFHETLIFASDEEDAVGYYLKYKHELPDHKAYSIGTE